jgi:hypothetical protein
MRAEGACHSESRLAVGITGAKWRGARYHPAMADDQSRTVATRPDSDYSLSVDEALDRYATAGHPRTPRSIQRYCAKGHLECRLVETPTGEKYKIAPDSLERHINYIEEVTPATSRDVARPFTPSRDNIEVPTAAENEPPASHDEQRPVATSPDLSRYVSRLEGDVDFLRSQLAVKDEQIKDLTERARETNHLIAGLQKMLTPLLGPSQRGAGDSAGNNL